MGLGALPDDAEWITIFYTDRESAVSMDMVIIVVATTASSWLSLLCH